MLWRMMIWDKVDPPFGSRFCRFWGEIELEYMPDVGASVNHWRIKRSSRPNQFLSSAGVIKDEVVFLPGGRPVQRVVFYGNDGTSPIFWIDCLTSHSGSFPMAARAGLGCINTKLDASKRVSSPPFQGNNLQWQMLERRADPPADNQLWVGVGGKYSGTLGWQARKPHTAWSGMPALASAVTFRPQPPNSPSDWAHQPMQFWRFWCATIQSNLSVP